MRRPALASAFPAETGCAALAGIIGKRHWWRDGALRKAAEPVLIRLGRAVSAGRGNGKRAKDPVAHFHLSNGARVERLNMAGDTSDKGAKESATLMVNYLYDPGKDRGLARGLRRRGQAERLDGGAQAGAGVELDS